MNDVDDADNEGDDEIMVMIMIIIKVIYMQHRRFLQCTSIS